MSDEQETLIDEVYQHINNGGITFQMLERKDLRGKSYHFRVQTNHFGAGTEYTFPLPRLVALDEVIGSLQRARDRMSQPDFEGQHPFGGRYSSEHDPFEVIRDGQQITLRERNYEVTSSEDKKLISPSGSSET